jgi:hypothetical protein
MAGHNIELQILLLVFFLQHNIVIPDRIVSPWVCVLAQWLKAAHKQWRVKAISRHGPGVKSKASTKLIGRIGKHPDRWDFSSRKGWLRFTRLNRGLFRHPSSLYFEEVVVISCLISILPNLTIYLWGDKGNLIGRKFSWRAVSVRIRRHQVIFLLKGKLLKAIL